ncbi:MAG: hypothetical protein JJT85_08785 [Chromatiales bacterium]|nr:hypothetical protein [Chromatiales bacterium]
MKRLKHFLTVASYRRLPAGLALLAAAPLATAANVAGNIEFARVLDVQPMVRSVMVQVPVRECVEVPGQIRPVQSAQQGTVGATVAGGVIGGLVGNNFGGGSGNDAMRLFGTLVGAAVGNDLARQRQAAQPVYWEQGAPVTQCTTRQVSRTEERFDGYSVTYEFHGRRYTTVTREHPGELMPVHVSVQPAL